MRIFSLVILPLLLLPALYAQDNDEELAAHYYNTGEFEKAVVLYKKIHRNKPSSLYIYENYLSCLLELNEEKDAESLVRKQIKRYPKSFNYSIDLGYVYFHFDEKAEAEKHFAALIDEYSSDRNATYMLAQSFLKRDYTLWAIKTYEAGAGKIGMAYYWQHLMSLYRLSGDFEKMTDLGLEVLQTQPGNLETILGMYNSCLDQDGVAEYIQTRTLQYVQKHPDKPVYDELLMNVYIQQNKFKAAYRQAIAMDKRNNEEGRRLYELAKICIDNKAYEVAELCYQVLIDKGRNSLFYIDGEVGLLNTLYLKTTESYEPDSVEIETLTSKYRQFITKYGYSAGTASSAKRLAELYIFYIGDTKSGISVLQNILLVNQVHPSFKGETKLLLADAYMMMDEIWEAKLLYGQVDKEFKEDPLGQEAKFRNARLSYFTGDFEWAREQLDILKTATTQLISNNAIDLSLLIQDNTGLDSTEDAMKEYARAEFLLYRNKTEECMQILNLLPFKYPNHSLHDEIFYLKAQVMEKRGKYKEALTYYKNVYEAFSTDILADNALFRAAEIYQYVLKDSIKARDLYEVILLDYNSSLYSIESRKRYNELNDKPSP